MTEITVFDVLRMFSLLSFTNHVRVSIYELGYKHRRLIFFELSDYYNTHGIAQYYTRDVSCINANISTDGAIIFDLWVY